MKRSLLAAALLAATATTAFAASASQEITLRKAGYWSATYYASNSDGNPMCAVKTQSNLRGDIAIFMIKYETKSGTFVQIAKTSWNIPKDAEIAVTLTFDSASSTAIGTPSPTGKSIQSSISPDFEKDFLNLFASANRMELGFKSGNEKPWIFNMSGSREVSDAFAKCVAVLKERNTQPFSTNPETSQSTQPFGAKPAVTNPAVQHDDGGI